MPYVVNPAGEIVSVDESQLDRALASGFRLASEDETAKEFRKKWYADKPFSGLQAAAKGWLDVISFGTATPAILKAKEYIQGQEESERHRKYLKGIEEAHPDLYTAGELVGWVTPIGAPGRLAKVAQAGERAVAKRLAGEGIASYMTRGAIEGAGMGVQQYIHETASENNPVDVERLASFVLSGGAMGGALGASLGGLVKTARAIAPSAQTTRDVLFRAFAKGSEAMGASDAELLSKFNPFTKQGAEAYALSRSAPGKRDALFGEGRDLIDSIYKQRESISSLVRGEAKAEEIAKVIKKGNETEVALAVQEIVSDSMLKLDDMLNKPGLYSRRATKDLREFIVSKRDSFFKTQINDEFNGRAHSFVDGLKRKWQESISDLESIGKKKPSLKNRATQNELKLFSSNRLQPFLEDSGLWGGAGEFQRAINNPWAHHIPQSNNFESRFIKWLDEPGFGKRPVINDSKWKQFTESIIKDPKHIDNEIVEEFLGSIPSFTDAIASRVSGTEAQKISKEITENSTKLLELVKDARKATLWEELLKKAGPDFGPWRAMNTPLAFMMGGPAGLALHAMSDPILTIHRISKAREIVSKVSDQTDKTVGKLVSGAIKLATKKAPELVAKGVTLVELKDKDDYDKTSAAVDRFDVTQPAKFTEALNVPIAGTLQYKAELIKTFLSGKMPMRYGSRLLNGDLSKVSKTEANRFMDLVKTAKSPLHLLESNIVTSEMVSAAETIWPEIVSDLRKKLVMEVSGKKLPYKKRLKLQVILGTNVDGTMNAKFHQELSVLYKRLPGPGRPPERQPPELSKAYEFYGSSRTERGTWK